ncbi:Single-stranded DNA-binding protein [Halomicronema hongdechloris C2206]|uniref:Single-stranded DNA-binding protein n=1 Tax=Halomicronema hongdechloris C2206 TaxID=1641165 RepID=A0A1Z3HS30_9CYAN|nr:single-stranded DNA-binding protein [Halomicronema hongdechloris]ASC73121.1 Single-stranded DNA-binding protein [Halomicronema hongdechloris C2206]
MNYCMLMADIVQAPQLRYTSDTQTPVAEFVIQFPGLRSEDASERMKAVGWGNLAQEIQAQYHEGDRILVEGRLRIDSIERPEGFREKQAEMIVRRIHHLSQLGSLQMAAAMTPSDEAAAPSQTVKAPPSPTAPAMTEAEPDYDDIPF